ncbi:polynucleotide adenylyltransferase [Halomonas sp. MCCC 1A17488]|uniref:polynucleotide adenylyltransferase n=1 Tax=unclassified Halomonas TaxID=2609666 RepID=UPI0018D20D4D|nr:MULTISPECIES: polynucleotide adenylyltransferase [unclassified Halomonas]MCE8016303.1 polynucleotide adenylyltransferase [Halomonas sp. MCCC 1A17488]MCG3239636.1 polynucleotide adenylyltransferase [Halomonas sp. MCCC 1A17488]QPP50452.1 polynucleotide adenylyltransferase [Halomonas sp. SS10-MC5]
MSAARDRSTEGLEVYRVGGAVRDARLGWPTADTDWVVVGATPAEMQRRGFRPVGRDFPVFLHPETHEEYALARTERKSGHGYTGFEVHASPDVTLEEDLARRDLTINAMAETPEGELVDPYGGQQDLSAKVLRHVSPAFVEDPLRVLRTARFLARYARLGFVIAGETRALMGELATSGELTHLVAERVWTETEKALAEADPAVYFRTLHECGALTPLMPELVEEEAAFERALARLARLPGDLSEEERPRWRWARLVEHLGDARQAALAERLRLPRRYRDLGRQAALTRQLRQQAAPGADDVKAWLDGIDAWRRDERVPPLIALVALDAPGLAERLERAWRAVSQLEARRLVAEGFHGGELGRELARRRRAILVRELSGD